MNRIVKHFDLGGKEKIFFHLGKNFPRYQGNISSFSFKAEKYFCIFRGNFS
jgi:hypothetical protein